MCVVPSYAAPVDAGSGPRAGGDCGSPAQPADCWTRARLELAGAQAERSQAPAHRPERSCSGGINCYLSGIGLNGNGRNEQLLDYRPAQVLWPFWMHGVARAGTPPKVPACSQVRVPHKLTLGWAQFATDSLWMSI